MLSNSKFKISGNAYKLHETYRKIKQISAMQDIHRKINIMQLFKYFLFYDHDLFLEKVEIGY